jgi:hypothetical protein
MTTGDGKWKPGQSGNPHGRPKKGFTLREVLRNKINRDAIVDRLLADALAGDTRAMRMVLAYHDGLPATMAPDEGQVAAIAPVVLLPSNGREFSEAADLGEDDDEEDGE